MSMIPRFEVASYSDNHTHTTTTHHTTGKGLEVIIHISGIIMSHS